MAEKSFRIPSFIQITVSVFLGLVSVWVLGFFIFFAAITTQGIELADTPTDAAVVLTGGPGRVEAGFRILIEERAKTLLISGVHRDATLDDLVAVWNAPEADKKAIRSHCCITLGHEAGSTEGNAAETAAWLHGRDVTSIRLVTSNYHMPRAWILFHRELPETDIRLWPVSSNGPLSPAFWRNLFVEYGKTLLTWMA